MRPSVASLFGRANDKTAADQSERQFRFDRLMGNVVYD